MVRFDIVFYVRMKDGLSQIIINVEAQKDEPGEYEILNRAVFYVSRLVSSQKERDFENSSYDDIKSVYSIWICMNMDYNSLSHIHLAKDEMLSPYDWKGNMDLLNIVLVGITNDIPEHDENYEMHRLIGALLSTELREQEKLDIIEHEYNIPISNELREDVRIMCNLSTGIEEKATEKTSEKHTVGQSVKLSISNEGLEYYRNRIQQSGQEKYDDVVQRKELLASKKISDIDYSYEIQKKAAQQNQNVDTGKSALNITDKANNYVKAYAELYDEIVKGYENGTREIYVADENGPRKLTKDEELSNLDAAYKKTVDDFVTMETTNQHARGIIGEEMNKISKITTRSTLASAYIEEQKTKCRKTK